MTPYLYFRLASAVFEGDVIYISFSDRLTCLNAFMESALQIDTDGSKHDNDSINKIDELISRFKEEYKLELEAEEVGEI